MKAHYRTLRDAIGGLPAPLPALMPGNRANPEADLALPNHEYYIAGYSPRYLARNQARSWDKPAFTVLAKARHTAQHPGVKMERVEKDRYRFVGPDRRLSVRECARIQGFSDSHHFVYSRVGDGYAMTGNALPVQLSRAFASAIKMSLRGASATQKPAAAPYCTAGDALRRWDTAEQPARNHIFHRHSENMIKRIRLTKPGEGVYRFRQAWVRLHADRPAPTVMGCHGGVFIHPWRDRCLSPRELAVLQGFHTDHIFSGSKSDLWTQIGNAVPPLLSQIFARALLRAPFDSLSPLYDSQIAPDQLQNNTDKAHNQTNGGLNP